MAFNAEGTKEIRKPAPLVYGINKNAILLPYFNLNNEQKKELGLRVGKNESEYILKKKDKDTGEDYNTLMCELYIKIKDTTLKGTELEELHNKIFPVTFFINDIDRPTGPSTKSQYINKIGQSAWLFNENDEENMKWWKDTDGNINKEGLRRALGGESDFMEALSNLSGFSRGGYEMFDWKKLFNGNFSEIRTSLKDMIEYHRVKSESNEKNKSEPKSSLLFYIRESESTNNETGESTIYYNQQVWNKAFNPNSIRKELNRTEKAGYPLKGTYQKDGVVTNYLNEFIRPDDFKPDGEHKNKEDIDLPF